LIQEEAQQLN